MRRDLQKLLCEQQRYGSTRSYKEVRRDRTLNEATNDEDFSAGREGMRYRYLVKGINKEFSENFNPLWGIIRKNVNRKWDDVFSELCEVFDMRNHVNAHILVHLWQFVERDTFVDAGGKVCVHNSYNGDVPIETSGSEYYVHPLNGLLLANKGYKNWKQVSKERDAERAVEARKTRIVISKELELRRRDEESAWFVCTYAPLPQKVRVQKIRAATKYSKEWRYEAWEYPVPVIDAWTGKSLAEEWKPTNYCVSYRTANKKELKKYGAK